MAQPAAKEPAHADWPVSFSIPWYFVNDSNENLHFGTGFSGSLRVSRAWRGGFTLRLWPTELNYTIPGSSQDLAPYGGTSYAYSTLAHLEWYPLRSHPLFLRFGSGVSVWPGYDYTGYDYTGDNVVRSDDKQFSLLAGFGIDIPVAQYMFISPQYEFMKFLGDESSGDTGPSWLFQMGLALTLR
jgi:hypothetical protein